MKISKRDDFSLIFMSVLAKTNDKKGFVSLSTVAQETHLSPLFLKHIALTLKGKGLVESREGVAGGYRLTRSPEKITVAEIISSETHGCISLSCNHTTCRIDKGNCLCYPFWNRVGKEMFSVLEKINLSDFIKQ